MFFKVKREGWEDPTLEPASNFFQRFSSPLIQYGMDKGVQMVIFREFSGRGCKSKARGGGPIGGNKKQPEVGRGSGKVNGSVNPL